MIKIDLEDIDFEESLTLMKIEDWIKAVEDGIFVNYDGFGFLSTETQESNLMVRPSFVLNHKIIRVSTGFEQTPIKVSSETLNLFTHITWYNR